VSEQTRSEETTAVDAQPRPLQFKPDSNPWAVDDSSVPTLHGLTHEEICEIIGGERVGIRDRYIDVSGPFGSLSGYVKAECFEAICLALGVQS
jgi:hypothetical protein